MQDDIARLHTKLSENLGAAQEQHRQAMAAIAAAKAELQQAKAMADLTRSRELLQGLRNLERAAAWAESRMVCARGDLMRFENKYRINRRPAPRRRYRSAYMGL